MRTEGVTRRQIMASAAGVAVMLPAPAVLGQAKSPYAGTTIRGAAFSLPFHQYLRNYFPEFEQQTGIRVSFDIEAFPIYNQRMDLELSTGGSSYDVIIVTFIYQGKWIAAGWVTDLDEFTTNPNATPAAWDPGDFFPGVEASMRDEKGQTFAYGVEAGAMILAAARADLIDRAGLTLPATMDDVMKVCAAVNGRDGVAA
jgi:multiple sugar transport system substrate-binding protein